MSEVKVKKKPAKPSCLDDAPELVTHRKVAALFDVTPAGLRKWVEKGLFPIPHSVISQTWYYRAEWIAQRLKTGRWPEAVKYLKD